MRFEIFPSAYLAPLCRPEILRQARVRQRASVSEAVARVMADHAFGEGRDPQFWQWPTGSAEAKNGCRS